MTTKSKVGIGAVAIISTLMVALFVSRWYQPTNYKGMYCNDLTTVMASASSRQADVDWQVRNSSNEVAWYGMDSYITSSSHYTAIADYNLRARRKGIKSIGFIYSSTGCLTAFDNFQKSQTNDSCKFSQVASEIEQYASGGNRPLFYSTLRTWCNYSQTNNIESVCYQGWPTQTDVDTIVRYTTRTFLHCYRPNPSASDFWGYTNGRLKLFQNTWTKYHPTDTTAKYNIVIIYSDEAAFSGTYFKTHAWDDAHALFTTGFNLYAPSAMKNRILIGGRQIFTSKLAKVTKPS